MEWALSTSNLFEVHNLLKGHNNSIFYVSQLDGSVLKRFISSKSHLEIFQKSFSDTPFLVILFL